MVEPMVRTRIPARHVPGVTRRSANDTVVHDVADPPMTPEQALLRVIHCLDRALASPFKTKAFVRALDVVRSTDPIELAERASDDQRLTELDGIGDATAGVITEALAGRRARRTSQDRGRVAGRDHRRGRRRTARPCAATATCTRPGATAAPRSRRWRRRRSTSATSTWC